MTDLPPSQPPSPGYVPARPPGAPYPPAAAPKTSGMAVASLVLGIAGICTCGLSAIVGLILGIVALRQIGRSAGTVGGRGLAIGGIAASAVGLVIGLLLGMFFVGSYLFVAHRAVLIQDEFRHYEAQEALDTTADALELYRMDVGRYPTEAEGGLDALVSRPAGVAEDVWHGPYLNEVPVDTWGNPPVYEPPDPSRRDLAAVTYHIWSTGPDGMVGTPDDVERE